MVDFNSWFCLAVICWCAWPYRLCLNKKTNQREFDHYKALSVKPDTVSSPDLPGDQSYLGRPSYAPVNYDNFVNPSTKPSNTLENLGAIPYQNIPMTQGYVGPILPTMYPDTYLNTTHQIFQGYAVNHEQFPIQPTDQG